MSGIQLTCPKCATKGRIGAQQADQLRMSEWSPLIRCKKCAARFPFPCDDYDYLTLPEEDLTCQLAAEHQSELKVLHAFNWHIHPCMKCNTETQVISLEVGVALRIRWLPLVDQLSRLGGECPDCGTFCHFSCAKPMAFQGSIWFGCPECDEAFILPSRKCSKTHQEQSATSNCGNCGCTIQDRDLMDAFSCSGCNRLFCGRCSGRRTGFAVRYTCPLCG
jgi:hypothetical protein